MSITADQPSVAAVTAAPADLALLPELDLPSPRPRIGLPAGRRRGDRLAEAVARTAATGAGAAIVAALAGVLVFLLVQGWPALSAGAAGLPAKAPGFAALAGPLAFGSLWASVLALALAAPVAVAVALAITQYAPRRCRTALGTAVDLLAAVPSVVYGLWGLMVVAPLLARLYPWLSARLGWLPLFAGQPSASGRTILTAAVVLALMVVPIMAAVCREVFAQAPASSAEAALGLGATRWEMIRLAVLPFARSGVISGAMLGLGRALGETMAVAMVLSPTPFLVSFRLLESSNPNTVAAFIAQTFPEAHGLEVSALIALGLILFALTFAVNALARRVAAHAAGQPRGGRRRFGRDTPRSAAPAAARPPAPGPARPLS
ncbi:MAG: phosphate ABC transporter permease subunit PstC, partial [Propionibacteriaceae bacterium]|nr:phosphate ABC transporter permease subunit PstC [Propionibacteriaceae bacterium]